MDRCHAWLSTDARPARHPAFTVDLIERHRKTLVREIDRLPPRPITSRETAGRILRHVVVPTSVQADLME